MAYVGTPRSLGSARDTLASILQGEASSRAGQEAVANVIANRADVNFGRHGSDVLAQATARNQFQGQATPTAQSYAIADQLLDGSLPRTLPNSLNYAAPVYSGAGATTAGWALRAINSGQGVNIGGNIFFQNDRGGTPTYTPGAAAAATTAAGVNGNGVAPNVTTSAGDGSIVSQTNNPDGSTSVTLGGGDGADAAGSAGAGGALAGAGGQFPGLGGVLGAAASALGLPPGVSTAIMGALGLGGAASAAAGGNISGFNAAGPVQASPGLVSATNQLATNTKEGDKAITDGVKTAGQTVGQSITSSSSAWLSWASDSFLRLAFIVTGLVLFGAALWYFARPQIEGAASAVADVIPAGRAAKAVSGMAKRIKA